MRSRSAIPRPALRALLLAWVIGRGMAAFAAADPAPSTAPPSITCEIQGALDQHLGKARPGAVVAHAFEIVNRGTAPLAVRESAQGCHRCLPLELGDAPIPPGKTRRIGIRYETGLRRQAEVRRAWLETSDPARPLLEVVTRWDLEPYIDITPDLSEITTKTWDQAWSTSLTLESRAPVAPFQVTRVETSSPHVVAGPLQPDPSGRRAVLSVRILPSLPAGKFHHTVTLHTDLREAPTVEAAFFGKVEGPFACRPAVINFGRTAPREAPGRQAALTLAAGAGFLPQGLEFDKTLLECRLTPRGREQWILECTLLPGLPPGAHRSSVRVKTNCPVQPALEIPVLAVVAPASPPSDAPRSAP